MKKVSIFSNQIWIYKFNGLEAVGDFISAINECVEAGYINIKLMIASSIPIYPNAACPIAGLIQYYERMGIAFETSQIGPAADATCLTSPAHVDVEKNWTRKSILNKVWEFTTEEDTFQLTQAFINELFQTDVFEKGALESLEWSLYEIMDNVINHAETDSGFIMGQIHPKSKHIAFCIFDTGRGIYNSLQDYDPKPQTPLDALTLCIKSGVTRGLGQGNGMFGLYEIVRQNEGQLTIASSGAILKFSGGELKTSKGNLFVSEELGCTSVDFQLDYAKPISLDEALKATGVKYPHVNHRLESLENDSGEIIFRVKDNSSGFGTRKAGAKIRNEVINIYKETGQTIIIDFEGIPIVASSFADEFIGKLVLEFGFFGFNNIVRLRNMNGLTQSIVQKSVSQRMAESIKSGK